MEKNLTKIELLKICKENKYIAVRFSDDNDIMGVNCRVVEVPYLKQKAKLRPDNETMFNSWYPISFSEYIRIKAGFIPTPTNH